MFSKKNFLRESIKKKAQKNIKLAEDSPKSANWKVISPYMSRTRLDLITVTSFLHRISELCSLFALVIMSVYYYLLANGFKFAIFIFGTVFYKVFLTICLMSVLFLFVTESRYLMIKLNIMEMTIRNMKVSAFIVWFLFFFITFCFIAILW